MGLYPSLDRETLLMFARWAVHLQYNGMRPVHIRQARTAARDKIERAAQLIERKRIWMTGLM